MCLNQRENVVLNKYRHKSADALSYRRLERLETFRWILMCKMSVLVQREGVLVFALHHLYLSMYLCASNSLSPYFPHSRPLTGLPEAEPNERISIRQQWILNCALTDGWIRGDGAPFQQDLRCDSQSVWGEGAAGGKKEASTGERKIWLPWWSNILAIIWEKPCDVITLVHKSLRKIWQDINGAAAVY